MWGIVLWIETSWRCCLTIIVMQRQCVFILCQDLFLCEWTYVCVIFYYNSIDVESFYIEILRVLPPPVRWHYFCAQFFNVLQHCIVRIWTTFLLLGWLYFCFNISVVGQCVPEISIDAQIFFIALDAASLHSKRNDTAICVFLTVSIYFYHRIVCFETHELNIRTSEYKNLKCCLDWSQWCSLYF